MARAPKQHGTTVDLDSEESIGVVGEAGKVVPATSKNRTGVTRKDPTEHPPCPHCGGKMHWNQAAATINFECMWRQYALAKGLMNDPNERLPVFTDEDLTDFVEWRDTRKRSRKNPLTYGKMPSDKGYGTYSAMKAAESKDLKSATEMAADVEVPKKKGKKAAKEEPTIPVKASKPGKAKKNGAAHIEEVELPVTVKVRPSKSGKPKKVKAAPADDVFDLDELDLDIEPAPVKSKKSKGGVATAPAETKSLKAKSPTGKKKSKK